ncbi:aspartate/glutamate racemase family protein [Rhodocista pekingensis]|uniref:Aspartate/glutamate racemase family protein n=1 Tax=Rhodocista pekingensis TaxID=201185 RepID=A0ABW2KQH2_9PROT
MRTLGLIGGMSWESTAVYYRLLNRMVRDRLGGLHSARLLLFSVDFAEIAALQAEGRWSVLTERMVDAGRRLRAGGAEALLICTNTMHLMAAAVEEAAGLPVIHIADTTAAACRQAGVRRPLLLATRYTMEHPFYAERLHRHGLEPVVPDPEDRATVHRIIYEELCRGEIREDSRAAYRGVIDRMQAHGADGVILGCTEIGLLIGQEHSPLPVFDTTEIHCAAAVDFALAPGA